METEAATGLAGGERLGDTFPCQDELIERGGCDLTNIVVVSVVLVLLAVAAGLGLVLGSLLLH